MIALLAALAAGLREMTDPQFADLLANLRRELAPANAMEGLLVERALVFVGRMRKAARLEDAGAPPSSAWLRYEAMAERGFWKALAAIDRGRKPQGKARATAPAVAVEVAPAPTPAPAEPAPAAKPSTPATLAPAPRPAPTPAPKMAPTPAPKPAPAPASSKRPEPKFLRDLGKRRPPQRPLPPFPPAQPGAVLSHISITPAPKHRIDDRPWPFEI